MVMAEMSTFGIFRGRNVQAETSMAEMSVAEMSEHQCTIPIEMIGDQK